MSERPKISSPDQLENGSFTERHPYLAYMASHWELSTILTCLVPTAIGLGFMAIGNGIDLTSPGVYKPEAVEMGVVFLKSAAMLWSIYGIAKVGTILTGSVQRYTQNHLHQNK